MRNFIYQSIVLTGVFTHTLECLKSLNGYEVNASYLVKSPGAEIGTITSKITNTGALNSTTATIQTLTAPAITATSINNIPILSTQTTAVTGTGQTITALPTTGTLILIVPNNTTLASANINFPTSPVDGQIFTILLGGINSSITQVNNSAATGNLLCTNPITTLSTNATATYVYSASKNTWYLASAFPNIDGGLEVQKASLDKNVNNSVTCLPNVGTLELTELTTDDEGKEIANATIKFPPNPADNQPFIIISDVSITSLSSQGGVGGATAMNPPGGKITANGTITYIYLSDKNKWYVTSSYPTEGSITADSLTITGNLTVDGASDLNDLKVKGNFSQTGDKTFTTGTGAVSLNGDTTVADGKTFNVGTGLTTLNGGLTIPEANNPSVSILTGTGTVTIESENAGNAITLNASKESGKIILNTTDQGSIDLMGKTIIKDTNTFTVGTGATTLGGTLSVTGATTLTALSATGKTTLSTIEVTDATTLDTTLDVKGATTLDTTLEVKGAATLGGTLSVTGNYSSTNGNITLTNGALSVGGASTLTGNTTVGGTLNVTGVTTFNNNVSIAAGKTFGVGNGATTLGGNLTVTGLTTLNGGLTTSGANSVTLGSSDIIKLTSTKNSRSAIEFIASDNLGGITFTGDTFVADGKTFTVKDSLTTLGGGLTTTGNNELKLNSGTALMSLTSTNATANAIALTANSAGGGMTLTAGSGNINLAGATNITGNTTVAGANTFNVGTGLTTLGGGLTVSGTANINLANTGTGNITLTAGSGGIQATSSGNGANAIKFSTVTAKAADGILLSNTADAGGITLTAATGASSINLNPGTVGFLVNNAGIAAPITLNSGAATINLTNTDVGSIILAAGTNGLHGTSTGPGANAIKFSTSTAATADGILLSNTASNGGITLTAATDASSINLNPGTAGFLVNNAGTIAAPITLKSGAAAINLTNTNAGSIILTAGTNGLHGTSTSTDAEAIKLNAIVGGILLKAEGDNKGITLQTTDDDGAITLTSGSHSANAIKLDAMGGFLNTLSLNSNGTPADAISLIASADTGGITLKSGTGNINMDGILLQGFQSTEVADAGTVTPINNKVRTLVLRTADGATIANATINFHANPFPGQYFTIVMGKGTITDIAINSIKDLNVAVTTLTTGTAVTYVYDGNISQWCFVC